MSQARGVGRRGIVRPLCGRLGLGDGHAVPVDQAGRLALGRHAQRHDRALAQGHPGKGRHALPVQPCESTSRRPCSRWPASPSRRGERRDAEPVRRDEHGLQLQRRQRARAARGAVLRDVRQSRRLLQGLERGDQAPHAVEDGRAARCPRSTTTSGSCTTAARTGRRRTTSRRKCPTCCTSCSGCC